jgi:predicted O-methyltransferase YrrM
MQIQTMVRNAYHSALQAQFKRTIARAAASTQLPPPMRRALTRTLSGPLSASERERLEAIAALRTRLESCDDTIEVVDFGAGSPQSNRSEEEMMRGVVVHTSVSECARASKDALWGTLLFMLVREYGFRRVLELGTNLGVSAAYQASALDLNGDNGRLITCEGAPELADRALANVRSLGLNNVRVISGRFADTLPRVCEYEGPFDFVFIDGHHDEAATLRYFEEILPHTVPGAAFVFDDIEWSAGMRQAWATVERHAAVRSHAGLHQLGICITDPVASSAQGHPAVTTP